MRQALRFGLSLGLVGMFFAFAITAGHISFPPAEWFWGSQGGRPAKGIPASATAPSQGPIPAVEQSRIPVSPAPPVVTDTSAATAPAPKIEVARLDPDGVSVIAGRAPAGSKLTIHANGEPIAEVTASADGQWSTVVTRAFPSGAVDLALSGGEQVPTSAKSAILTVVVPKGSGQPELYAGLASPRPILTQRTVGDATRLAELTAQVARARTIATRAPSSEPLATAPITFMTNEATMTAEGRLAAALLVEYLRINGSSSITLTGHADERGTDEFNVELSRRRLEAVERHVRAAGYTGRLVLLPKGRSEPYAGIDRSMAPVDAIMQADRRVELQQPR